MAVWIMAPFLVWEEDRGVWTLTDLLKTPALLSSGCGLLGQSLQHCKPQLGDPQYVLQKLESLLRYGAYNSYSPGQKQLDRSSSPAPSLTDGETKTLNGVMSSPRL